MSTVLMVPVRTSRIVTVSELQIWASGFPLTA
jgi:hypothetical protein